ncbi:MAG: ATP-binding protein [Pseudomonadota bacterium]
MAITRRTGLFVLTVIGLLSITSAAYLIAGQMTQSDLRASGQRQLQIIAPEFESVLEKYEMLPFVLAFQPEVFAALTQPDNQAVISGLNNTLRAIQQQAKVAAIHVMDRNGKTLAAHDGEQAPDPDAGSRPAFRDAMAGKTGRFYATGGEPGYFVSQPVYRNGAPQGPGMPIGVVTVKISLAEFERTWSSSEDPIALIDQHGVIFLSSRSDWRYRSHLPLEPAVRDKLTATRQYGGREIVPLAGIGAPVSQAVNRLGWQLLLYPSEATVRRNEWLAAAGAALLLAIIGCGLWAVNQRKRWQDERLVSRKALLQAAAEFDRNIAQRTQALFLANQNLEAKLVKLKNTEQGLLAEQNKLVQAGKLSMLGQLATGVVHELTQPLATIHDMADNGDTLLSRREINKAKENLAHISAAAARMSTVIAQLKGFERRGDHTLARVDLAEVLQRSALLLENDFLRQGVQLEIKILEPAEIAGDAVRIEQVVINLLRNALEAADASPAKKVTATLERAAGDVLLRVRDSGIGMPRQVAEHLFEPFFTTKPARRGLGLGLAISSAIVLAMNGQLTAKNHVNGGAEFVLRLPLPL